MHASKELARFFKALSDETRLRLIALLSKQEPGSAMCVSRLARELETTTSNVSQHLRVLKNLGLIHGERRRHRIHYFLNPDRLALYRELSRDLLGKTSPFAEPQTLSDDHLTSQEQKESDNA